VLEGAATVPSTTSIGTSLGRSAPPSVAEIAPHFPDLEIIELLGAGGMGAVYKARQPHLDRIVAVKILSDDLAEKPTFAERFNREARVLARLSHPNIVAIFDYGTAGPYCYLLMEYVEGVNLRQAMRTGGFTPSEALALVEEVCSALKFAHEEGILHRDIKPENVLIDTKGRVKIADFGIAKLIGEGEEENFTLTLQGSILGSPHYMAPEQIETPGDVDQRADIYSLGVVLYEMLTGELPIGRFALPSEKASMDSRIDEIVLRTLEKERQARYQSAEEIITQVGALSQTPEPSPAAPAAQPDQGVARFSLAAAILTGLSLLFAVIAGMLLDSVTQIKPYRQPGTVDVGKILFVLMLISTGVCAVVGFILGAVALSQIRKSGGAKDGLGCSVFATVVWPILLLGILATAFLSMPMPDSEGRSGVGLVGIVFFIGIPQILAAFVLVRGLRRWARGLVTKDGEKRFPGLGGTILTAIGLVIFGLVSLEIVSRALPSSGLPDDIAEIEREMVREESKFLSGSRPSEDIEWYSGAPEVLLPVELYPGIRADFRLVRYEGTERNPEYAPLGTLLGMSQGDSPIRSIVEIGTSGPKENAGDRERGFTGMLDFTGQSGTLFAETDFLGWEFDFIPRNDLLLTGPVKDSIQIATRKVKVETGEAIAETLKLEINVSRR